MTDTINIKQVTLKIKHGKGEMVIFNLNVNTTMWFWEPSKGEKLIVSVNGKDTELKP